MPPNPVEGLVTFLYCDDLDAASDFYGRVLGLPLVLDQGACRIFRVGRDAYLGFCRATEHIGASRASNVILTLDAGSRENVDRWHEHLVKIGEGDRLEQPPVQNARFNIYHLFLRDPAGYLVEIQAFLDPSWPGNERREASL